MGLSTVSFTTPVTPHIPTINLSASNAAAMILDGPTKALAWKFYAASTGSMTTADAQVTVVGDNSGIQYTLSVESDSGDAPSGSVQGAATPAFAGPSSTGTQWLGERTFATPPSLTVNTPYWLVLRVSSGTPDGTHSLQARMFSSAPLNRSKTRLYNGTDWTTVAAVTNDPAIVRKVGGVYVGSAVTGSIATSSGATKIYGTNRQALRYRYGPAQVLRGVHVRVTKNGTPTGGLDVKVYEGTTLKATYTFAVADVVSGVDMVAWFNGGLSIGAGSDAYIVLGQNGDGGSTSNNYDARGWAVNGSYIETVYAPNQRFCVGTGGDPTTFTDTTTFVPVITPILGDPAADLVSAGGGGTTVITPVFAGEL